MDNVRVLLWTGNGLDNHEKTLRGSLITDHAAEYDLTQDRMFAAIDAFIDDQVLRAARDNSYMVIIALGAAENFLMKDTAAATAWDTASARTRARGNNRLYSWAAARERPRCLLLSGEGLFREGGTPHRQEGSRRPLSLQEDPRVLDEGRGRHT